MLYRFGGIHVEYVVVVFGLTLFCMEHIESSVIRAVQA